MVAQELIAHGFTPYYYNNKRCGEVDFLIEDKVKVLPIEVKSGKDYHCHRALSNLLRSDEFGIDKAIVFYNGNMRVDGKIVYAPIYMLMFLRRDFSAPTYYKIDLEGLR